MKTGTRLAAWLGRAAALGMAAHAAVAPDFGEVSVQKVPAGETAAAETLTFGDRAGFYKTGAGTLVLDAGRLARTTDGRLSVLEGAVAVTAGAAADFAAPPAACAKAAFWVNETSLVTTNGVPAAEGEEAPVYAARWCDVRETDRVAPTRLYAEPKWFGSAALPARLDGLDPVAGTFDGRAGVYFGGASSGQYMRWRQNGAETALNNIHHLFIVHAVTNCVGHPVGWETVYRGGPFLNTVETNTPAFNPSSPPPMLVNRGDVCGPQMSARFFLDGEQVDPRTTRQKAGWQLFACDYKDILPGADNFYRSGFGETLKGAQGGDWLGEALVFTNQLQEAERVAIERYLLAKWNLPQLKGPVPRVKGTAFALAAGTSVSVAGEAGTVTPPLAFTGAGDVAKTGEGVLALGPSDGLAFAGGFAWEAGALRLQGGRLPALAIGSGETYAFTSHMGSPAPSAAGDAASGLTCTKTEGGAAGEVATTGNGWLRVHTVKPGVRRLTVGIADAQRGAVLQLEGRVRRTAAPEGGDAEAIFPNPDMEQPFAITSEPFDFAAFQGTTLNGWTARGATPRFLCTQAPQPNAATGKNTWRQWFMSGDPAPRGGTNLLQLVQGDAASTRVFVPTGGVWELSFDAKSRYGYTNPGHNRGYPYADQQPQIRILLGRTWGAATDVATLPIGCAQFNRFRFRIAVPEAGDWELGFKPTDGGWDACIFLDNFRMVRVAEPAAEETFAIPNGNFDDLERPSSAEVTGAHTYIHARYGTLNVPRNWTLSVLPGSLYAAVVTNGVVGAITSGTVIEKSITMQVFPFAEAARGAAALGFVATGGVASTTFTVPAGTWRLRGLVQRLASYMNMSPVHPDKNLTLVPGFRATLTRADGSTAVLGEVQAATQRLAPALWPEAFTVAADEAVTLTLTQTNVYAMGLVDELALVRDETADFGNLIAEPGFETMTRWTGYAVPDLPPTRYHGAYAASYSDRPQYWGYSAYEGARRLRIQNRMGMRQDITVPRAGRYRFTMHVRARADGNWYANNPVRVWLAQGAATNVLATTPTLYARHWMEVSYLVDIPAAGAWCLGIEGRGWLDDTDQVSADLDAQIDDVSLVRCRDEQDDAPSLPRGLRIDVAKGAQLLLDYPGVAACGPVSYDGQVYVGMLDRTTHPAFITGPGTLRAIPSGSVLLVR